MLKAALAFAGFFLALMGCGVARDDENLPAKACLASVRFVSDDARAKFVYTNVSRLSAAARDRMAYATANGIDGSIIEFVSTQPFCTEASLRDRFDFDQSVTTSFSASSMQTLDAQARLSSALATRRDEKHQWRCVVRTPAPRSFARIIEVVEYVGLRGPQVEGANDDLFLAADEECEVVGAVIVQALHDADGRSLAYPQYAMCPASSLAQCGYPPGVNIVPSP